MLAPMKHLLATAVLSALTLATRGDVPAPFTGETAVCHDFGALKRHQADRLQGRVAVYRVELDSDGWEEDGTLPFDCTGREDASRDDGRTTVFSAHRLSSGHRTRAIVFAKTGQPLFRCSGRRGSCSIGSGSRR
jgi:hypothetical protein